MHVTPSQTKSPRGERVLVIGASMSGLLMARVLSSHFAHVTIIERDQLPDKVEPRQGVPQGKHLHGLLTRGATILESYFPGLFTDLVQRGANLVDIGRDFHWFHAGYWKLQDPNGIELYAQSRPLLEWYVRNALMKLPNIELIDNCDVEGICANKEQTAITGVRIHKREGEAVEEVIEADLVVDASGRGSQASRWLTALGYPQVEEENVHIDLAYATRLFKSTPEPPRGGKVVLVYPIVPVTRAAGGIFPIEDDLWMVTLIGWLKHHPPGDEAGFLNYARELLQPDLFESIKDAEPVTPISIHKFPSSRRRHYERMKRFPAGLLIAGDAFCSFNPVYGQGMTVAALEAEALDQYLKRHRHADVHTPAFVRNVHKRFFRVTIVPWILATGEDLRYPETEGKRMFGLGLMHWYIGRFFALTSIDPFICKCFYELLTMIKTPLVALHPRVFWNILFKKIPPGPVRISQVISE